MKKALIIATFALFCSFALADYSPVYKDYKLLESVYWRLNKVIKKSPDKALSISKNITNVIWKFHNNSRNYYILNEMNNYILQKIKNQNLADLENSEITKSWDKTSQATSKTNFYETFYNNHWLNIVTDNSSIAKCVQHFDLVDKVAKANNFPAELVLATWHLEANCNYYNPANTHWVFQIMVYSYGNWDITEAMFEQQIVDYINFVKNKRNRQNRSFVAWKSKLQISYDNYSINDLRIHWFLYNWIKKWVLPSETLYNNWNLNNKFKHNKDWLITVLLKILKWRVDNNK